MNLSCRWKKYSHPTTVDDELLACTHGAVIGCEVQRHARYIRWLQAVRQALPLIDLTFTGRCQPETHLPLGHDPAGHHTVYADALRSEFTRKGSRHAINRRFCRDIGWAIRIADHPGHRAKIDDRAAPDGFHVRPGRLCGEKLVAQVNRHAVVP